VAFFIYPLENNMPRWPEKVDSTEETIGQDVAVDVSTTQDVKKVKRTDQNLESEIVTVKGDGLDNSYAAKLAFLEEPVEVMVHESTDQNAEPIVHVACNGVNQFFPRGEVVTVKRKFLGVLASSKITSVTVKDVRSQDGDVINRINKHTALRFPFSVVRDSNPLGAAWLKSILNAA
jgi:hypothetical protein